MNLRKTATKFRMVNWARFQDETIKLSGSTLFAGTNGTGKSTILDAMTFLIAGNTQFNKAADDRDRDLKAYVRGDTKSNGSDRYLRTGEVVSYLLMEFFSETEKTFFTIGVCIESHDETGAIPYWFILPDTMADDVELTKTENGKLYIYPRNDIIVKNKKISSSEFYSREKAVKQVLRVLGLRCDASKYKSKLIKMIAFKPERDINKFIQNSVLDPGKVDSLAQVREQKEKNDELENFYKSLMESKLRLDEFENAATLFEEKEAYYKIRRLMLTYQKYQLCVEKEKQAKDKIDELRSKQGELARELESADKQQALAEERYREANSNESLMEFTKGLSAIEQQIEEADRELKELSLSKDKLSKTGAALKQLCESQKIVIEDEVLKNLSTFGQDLIPGDQKRGVFLRLSKIILGAKDAYYADRTRAADNLKEVITEKESLEKEKERLERNILSFPADAEKERDIIKAKLLEKGIDTEVRFFAELVKEIKDESWRAAIETFLGRKRFYIITDGKHCSDVMQIIRGEHLHNINAVITDKLPESAPDEGSAAGLLDIPNVFARRYANFLLGRIHLCDSIEELHEHPLGGITKDGMLAKSYAVSLMNIKKTRFFLGTEAIALRLKTIVSEIRQKADIAGVYEKNIATFTQNIDEINATDFNVDNYDFESPPKYGETENAIRELKAQKKKIEELPGIAKALEERSLAEENLNAARQRRDEVVGALKNCEYRLEEENEKLLAADEEIMASKAEYDEEAALNPAIVGDMIAEYDKLSKKRGSVNVITDKTVKNLETEKDKLLKNVESLQIECARLSEGDITKRGAAFIPFYRQQRNEITNVKMEEAAEKLSKHRDTMRSSFMNDFIGELKEKIDESRAEMDAINRELKDLPFGSDIYRFTMDEKSDRKVFFRIIRRLEEYGSAEMYVGLNADDEEFEHDVESFMNQILEDEDESEYTDYRNYFTYDMKIISTQGERVVEADYSKKQGSASGGEKQTPYFIILAASLMQCYPRNADCMRLAFIDEAFSALSRERIEQLVKYLEDNRFQVIYAAPPEKIASIGSYISSTVSLVANGRYTCLIEGLVKADDYTDD